MIERLKTNWEEFQESEPGERFKDRYNRRRQDEEGHLLKRILLIALGTVIAISSLALAPLPGPGWGTVFIGLMILGGELLPAARFLDWTEVRLRKLGRFIERIWQTSVLGKIVVIGVAAILIGAFVYLVYWLFFSG